METPRCTLLGAVKVQNDKKVKIFVWSIMYPKMCGKIFEWKDFFEVSEVSRGSGRELPTLGR